MKDILVIGESCRDVFVYCDTTRLAPDYPVPVLNIVDQIENAGMAKNVQRNIQSRVECDIVTNPNWQNITKTRYVHESTNHMFFRVDSPAIIDPINVDELQLSEYKLVVIADYNKGFLSKDDIAKICNRHNNVFIDTKKVLDPWWCVDTKYIKINHYEYQRSEENITDQISSKIIHTMGGNGCRFNGKQYPVKRVEVKDTSGAGDSFMAALVIKYLETEDIDKSIKYANLCAAETVKHRGVTII